MEYRILHAMAADLGIFKYENESESQYCNRVLYSAMASWIKAVALDQPVTSGQMDNPGVSRRHISDKCTAILNEMLKLLCTVSAPFSCRPVRLAVAELYAQANGRLVLPSC